MSFFPCTGCGACCRRLHLSDPKLLERSGLTHTDGVCEHLTDDNKCSIYEDRPEDCVIWSSRLDLGRTLEYWTHTAAICNEWMDEDGSECERLTMNDLFEALKQFPAYKAATKCQDESTSKPNTTGTSQHGSTTTE